MKHDALGVMLIEYLGLPHFITKATVTIVANKPTVVVYEFLENHYVNEAGELPIKTVTLEFDHWYEPKR